MFRRLALATVVLTLVACGPGGPEEVSLAELAFAMEDYDGSVVEVVGVVREFTEEEDEAAYDHFVIEDDDQNRVELVPHDAVAGHVGEQVRVVGEFTFDEARGRLIEVSEVEPEDREPDLARRGAGAQTSADSPGARTITSAMSQRSANSPGSAMNMS